MTPEETNVWHKIDNYLMRAHGSQVLGMEHDQHGDYRIDIRRFARSSSVLQVTLYAQWFRAAVDSDTLPPDFCHHLQRVFSNEVPAGEVGAKVST
jgi:hypothetical protein